MERVQRLVARGRYEDAFGTDLPTSWPIAVMHSVMHSAADEINAGRPNSDEAWINHCHRPGLLHRAR